MQLYYYIFNDNEPVIIGGKMLSFDEKNYNTGILRKGTKDDFKYIYINTGKEVSNKDLERIKSLKIPPMWDYCWISSDPNTEIQVVGHDSAGRKQYIYTQDFMNKMVVKRFNNLNLFIELLPKLNSILEKHNKLHAMDKNKVLSIIVRIIMETGIRAGKEYYVRTNKSYGITSLRKKHVKLTPPNKITFSFVGKRSINHIHTIKDTDIYNELYILLRENNIYDKVFVYKDPELNKIVKLDEFDLNDYLHEYLHPKIVIKDIRTFVVNYTLVKNIIKSCTKKYFNEKELKRNLRKIIKDTAEFIQHTPDICKKSYINPLITQLYLSNYDYFYKNRHLSVIELLKKILLDNKK